MRFFEQQAQARRYTVKLVVLYVTAMSLTVSLLTWASGWFLPEEFHTLKYYLIIAASFAGVMLAASWYRLRGLSEGGHVVAKALGGERIYPRKAATPAERRVLNVVEEMALASMMRLPKVYLLPDSSINAFAAGMGGKDAVIGITQGAVNNLNRAELQAVIAHEFSHILNGDTRLNMRLTGWLFGLQMIEVLGKYLMFGTHFQISGNKKTIEEEANTAVAGCLVSMPFTLLGLMFRIIGGLGALLAGWIQAAICRQREYLADASAVQFTRQTEGMVGALHKVAIAPRHRLHSWHAAEYAHFMFGSIYEPDIFDKLAATHPKIIDRIRRLSPYRARQLAEEVAAAEWLGEKQPYEGVFALVNARKEDAWAAAEAEAQFNEQQKLADAMRRKIIATNPDYAARQALLARNAPNVWFSLASNGKRAPLLLHAMLAPAGFQTALVHSDALGEVLYQRLCEQPLYSVHYIDLLEHMLPYAASLKLEEKLLPEAERAYCANDEAALAQHCVWHLLNVYLGRPSEKDHLGNPDTADSIINTLISFQTASEKNGGKIKTTLFRRFQTALNQAAELPESERQRILTDCEVVLGQWHNRAVAEILRYTLGVSLNIVGIGD